MHQRANKHNTNDKYRGRSRYLPDIPMADSTVTAFKFLYNFTYWRYLQALSLLRLTTYIELRAYKERGVRAYDLNSGDLRSATAFNRTEGKFPFRGISSTRIERPPPSERLRGYCWREAEEFQWKTLLCVSLRIHRLLLSRWHFSVSQVHR